MEEFQDMVLCYGESDEYSFVFKKETSLWGRRTSKITTAVVSGRCCPPRIALGL